MMNNGLKERNISFLNEKGIKYATVLLTENILSHSIFDANREIRHLLKESGLHDYSVQQNGVEHKVYINTHILTFMRDIPTKTSIYKAGTRGDNRMWFGSPIFEITKPNSTYVIFVYENELYVINISEIDIKACCTTSIDNPVKRFVCNRCK